MSSDISVQKSFKKPEERPTDPNVLQRQASDPSSSVWVNASAGTGKTKVLTDRVLRLLLPREDGRAGTDPRRILCLTFTKAAASEMALRVSETLSKWTTMSDDALIKVLKSLTGLTPNQDMMDAARRLFSQITDIAGGLNIMTIHSFCQSVLGRFPLESDLIPGFKALEESESRAMLDQSIRSVLNHYAHDKSDVLMHESVHILTSLLNLEQMNNMMSAFVSERYQVQTILDQSFDDVAGMYSSLCQSLDIQPDLNLDDYLRQNLCDNSFLLAEIRSAFDCILDAGTDKSIEKARAVIPWFTMPNIDRINNFDLYKNFFLTTKGDTRASLVTSGVRIKYPDCDDILKREAERILNVIGRCNQIKCSIHTRALFLLGVRVLEDYDLRKSKAGGLDFSDLILKTEQLLKTRPNWVMYKLDQGLDHILVDEAQDTNPEQWKIIDALVSEFYAGDGARDDARTLFVVGDEKQSIYGFQRASPEDFFDMRGHFQRKIRDADEGWRRVDLNTSFRSVQCVLDAVDYTYKCDHVRDGVSESSVEHISFRRNQGGCVVQWPLFKNDVDDNDEKDIHNHWALPDQIKTYQSGESKLCQHIATTIAGWLSTGEILPARGRTVQPGDVMILLRSRGSMMNQLTRALKNLNIPVGGADRIVLNESIAVHDMMAMAMFVLQPHDDLNLACLLKSPFIGMDEDTLFDVCHGREGSVWTSLQTSMHHADVCKYLSLFLSEYVSLSPYVFISTLLDIPCPAGLQSGLKAMRKRLGDDVIEPLDQLLNTAMHYEREHGVSLQKFVQFQLDNTSDIKRETTKSEDYVRIMTVHGAKGLQAPIVIMPDTIIHSKSGANKPADRILWPDKTGFSAPLWVPISDEEFGIYTDFKTELKRRDHHEYKRLLYVAMTRAEDRLYIGGYQKGKTAYDESWYFLCQNGLKAHPDVIEDEDGTLNLKTLHSHHEPDRLDDDIYDSQRKVDSDLPDWIYRTLSRETGLPVKSKKRIQSQKKDHLNNQAVIRGNAVHKLYEVLPDIAPEKRAHMAVHILNDFDLDNLDERDDLIQSVVSVIADTGYAHYFGDHSYAEVPIVLNIDGVREEKRIDRLIIAGDVVTILDYKTGVVPQSIEVVPNAYIKQLRHYRDAISILYPNHRVTCVLLWTDGPSFMCVDDRL